ncbi:MAG TPA: NADH-quinone oxidoreductase subunit NuoH [Ignavibacteria bacterium]|nr:NADH-quinone oxidoreductase subunit NuoH [Ignavibacteria bacterium]HMR40807.1 NADH-quinone oxidoreductase subunit NuoH [Ignavibacteria bacterium]
MGFSIYDFSDFINNIHAFLIETFSPAIGNIIGMAIVAVCFLGFIALLGLSLVYIERKVCALFQQRLGPMRVGKWGTAQTVADIIKLIFKEPLMTKDSDKFLFNLAPFIVMIAPVMAISLIPFASGLQAVDFDIGIFFIVAVSSIGVTGILLAGWSSNNKYSLIGAMRSGAQIVSYELSVILSLLTIVVLSGSLQLSVIVESQREGWWIFRGHIPAIIAFIIFIVASTAESNRGPFDMAEAESEITAGFHTEYSGIKFAYFFLAEYVNMFIIAAVGATIFFGGWMPLHIGNIEFFNNAMDLIPPVIWFFMKVSAIIFLLMWFKWTFPRLRIDQMLTLEWKYLLPLNIMNILLMSLVVLTDFHF